MGTLTLITAILYFAKAVFVPIALAVLLTFILAPLVLRFMRWGMNRTLAIITTVILAFSIIGVIGWLVTVQGIHLIDQLPDYQQNLQAKIGSLKRPHVPGIFQRASGVIESLQKELQFGSQTQTNMVEKTAESEPTDKPVPVEVKTPKPTAFQVVKSLFGPLLGPLGTAVVVVVLVIMILFQREDLRDRFIKLVSGGQLNVATQAVDDAAQRLSRFLLMNLLVNASYGIPIGVGLYLIGVPNALLWGLLAMLLRFIPYIGPWVAASFPLMLATAADPGWTKLFLSGALFVVVELICNNIIEPWLYGQSTGVSNVALIAAAVFWTWLWGAVGLFLSTPLTVCLMVMGKYVPGLQFLSVVLGSEPVLEPEARFYQRMLAMDEEEMLDMADEYCKQHSVEEFYDNVLLPALVLAEQDRHNGTLAEIRQQFILQSTRDLVQDLADRDSPSPAREHARPATASDSAERRTPAGPKFPSEGRYARVAVRQIACVPAKDDADELAGLMLKHVLAKNGFSARVFSVSTLPSEIAEWIGRENVSVICVSALPPAAVVPARNACKRFRQQFPGTKIIAGIWSSKAQPAEITARFSHWTDLVLTHVAKAAGGLQSLLTSPAAAVPPPEKAEPTRPTEMGRLPAADAEPEEIIDAAVREVAKLFNVPVSLVSLVKSNRQFWNSHLSQQAQDDSNGSLSDGGLCSQVELANDILVIPDISKESKLADLSCFKERGVRFFAGAPLSPAGESHPVGTLFVMDTEPHEVTDQEKAIMKKLADELVSQLDRHHAEAA